MHELALTREILAIATERAQGARVTKVVVAVGRLACVLPEALRFSFEAVVPGTPVEGAALEIRDADGAEVRVVELEVI